VDSPADASDAKAPPTPEQILAASWTKLDAAPTVAGKQDDLYFIDANEGWSVNGQGQIFHTQDGGASWQKLLDQPGTYFRAVLFLDAQRGFVGNIGTGYFPGVTDERPLFSTTDGGKSWNEVTSITGPAVKGICNFSKLDDQHLFATGRVGGPAFFMKSADGGATWTSFDVSSQIAMLIDSHFSTPTDGFIVGGSSTGTDSSCVILHTGDGGESWQNVFSSNDAGTMCWKFSFPSSQVGYASVLPFSGGNSSFVKTSDGGKTWNELPFLPGPYEALGVGFITDEIGWIGGDSKGQPAQRTKDGGKTWEADSSLGKYVNRFRFIDQRVGYAIGTEIDKLVIQ
jgi:photosystem II stability/assembly factor-like uncharacterized protein